MTELEKAADEFFLDNGECSKNNHIFDCSCSAESFIAGATWAFQNREVEKIICAACYFPDGIVYNHQPRNIKHGFVIGGWRHHSCITIADFAVRGVPHRNDDDVYGPMKQIRYRNMEIQGFLTSKGNFVDRTEAAVIAFSAGQISEPKEELYSEDLY